MSTNDLARRLVAAVEVHEQARILLAGEPYDLAQTNGAAALERLAAALQEARTRAEKRAHS
jgi:hypothetical protein